MAYPAWEEEESKKPPSLRQAYRRQAAPALAGQIKGASRARLLLPENALRSLPQRCSLCPDFCSNRLHGLLALLGVLVAAALLLAPPRLSPSRLLQVRFAAHCCCHMHNCCCLHSAIAAQH